MKKGTKAGRSRRSKCACTSCQCTVDTSNGVRKGNLVYCGRACMTMCTREVCRCEHDHCSV